MYYTATEIIEKLNATLPKELLPRSGKITKQAFYKKKKSGKFNIYNRDGKETFLWEEVAPTYNLKVETQAQKQEKLKADDSEFDLLVEELRLLMSEAITPNQKVEVEKKFWEAKTKELEYKEKTNELIPMEKIITTLSIVMPNLKDKIYKIPSSIKTSFPDTPIEVIEAIHEQVSIAFSQIQLHEFQ